MPNQKWTGDVRITTITANETLPLRQRALWPDHPPQASRVEGDATAQHYGGFEADQLICTASLFPSDASLRLRKFATAPEHQGCGFGSTMLQFLLDTARAQNMETFWMDARQSAQPFYARFGFSADGEVFFKRSVPYLRMSRRL